jgi:hypothetical protein
LLNSVLPPAACTTYADGPSRLDAPELALFRDQVIPFRVAPQALQVVVVDEDMWRAGGVRAVLRNSLCVR